MSIENCREHLMHDTAACYQINEARNFEVLSRRVMESATALQSAWLADDPEMIRSHHDRLCEDIRSLQVELEN